MWWTKGGLRWARKRDAGPAQFLAWVQKALAVNALWLLA